MCEGYKVAERRMYKTLRMEVKPRVLRYVNMHKSLRYGMCGGQQVCDFGVTQFLDGTFLEQNGWDEDIQYI